MLKKTSKHNVKIYRMLGMLAISWMILVALPSSALVRKRLAAPLFVHDSNAQGDVCYVLAGGDSIWERLIAGANLVHLGRVSKLHVMRNDITYPYNLNAQASWTQTQWIMDFLAWRGITPDRVIILDPADGMFGTLEEARNVTKSLPKGVKKLVVVSSPAHMRRTVLAFKRSLPANVMVVPYAATVLEQSSEMYSPIWIEYLKLLVYYIVA